MRDAGQLLILEEDTSPADVRVTESQNTEWLNFFLDEKNVQIMNFDMNQLQNEIWWTWFLVEFFNNNSIPNHISISFFQQYTTQDSPMIFQLVRGPKKGVKRLNPPWVIIMQSWNMNNTA